MTLLTLVIATLGAVLSMLTVKFVVVERVAESVAVIENVFGFVEVESDGFAVRSALRYP